MQSSNTIDNFLLTSAYGIISSNSNDLVTDMILLVPRKLSQHNALWSVWPVHIQIATFHLAGSTLLIVGDMYIQIVYLRQNLQ